MRGELSKSRYCKVLRYSKIFWLDEHKPEIINEFIQLLKDGSKCKTEVSFLYDGCFCSVDILRKTASSYDLIDVKSSSYVSEEHINNVNYHYYIFSNQKFQIIKFTLSI